jgi:hypothetical protein
MLSYFLLNPEDDGTILHRNADNNLQINMT